MPESVKKEVSCYSSSVLINYATEHNFSRSTLFDGIEEHVGLLRNQHEWTTMELVIHLMQNFERAGGNLFEAGVEITKNQTSNIQLLFLKVFSHSIIISKIPDFFSSKICTTVTVVAEQKSEGAIDVVFTPKTGSAYSQQICDFDRGCTFATLALKRLRNLQLTEITCAARSDSHECRYRITWTPDLPVFERLKNFFLFRVSSQKAILAHMEETYNRLQDQYKEILGIKDFYSHIMANMHEGILWLDGDGKVSFANKGFCSIVQRETPGDIIGCDFGEFLADDSQRDILNNMYTSCRAKPQVPELQELNFCTAKEEGRFGQTACLWVDSTAQQKPGFLLSIRDITDKRAIEHRLYAVENRYRTLYENSPAIIVGIDKKGDILYANPAMVEQSGYSEKELTGMHFSLLVAPPDSKADADSILNNLTGRVGLQETHYRTKDGDWKSVALATFPLYNDKWDEIGLGAIGVDVTETKRLNEMLVQTQRMDLLGQMAGGLAHDFKNLLSVVSGYGKLINKITTEPKVKEYAESILIANERAYNLTKNLLTFSRGETVINEPFIVNDVVNEVKTLLPAILGRNIRLTVEMADEPFCIKGDAGKINQCLLNLCINARDAMAEIDGSVIMRLKSDSDPRWVQLEVEDTGPGIPPDIIARIFDPFFSTKKKGEGTGLGLSVVYGIVKSHGGEITVDSRPGDGTTFMIRLPLFETENPFAENTVLSENGKITIVVIDNDMVFRNYCSQILGRQGYTVIKFPSVKETAVWLKQNGNINIILLLMTTYADEAESLPGFNEVITPLWIIEKDEKESGSLYPFLRRPFPPAALVATIRETVQSRLKTGSG